MAYNMPVTFSVRAKIDDAADALENTGKSLKSIQGLVLRTIAKNAVKVVKAAIRSSTNRRTGALLKAYGYSVRKDKSSVSVYPKYNVDENRTNFIKSAVLSWGRPERNIAPKGFVQAGISYVNGGSYGDEGDKAGQKELDKYWSR